MKKITITLTKKELDYLIGIVELDYSLACMYEQEKPSKIGGSILKKLLSKLNKEKK